MSFTEWGALAVLPWFMAMRFAHMTAVVMVQTATLTILTVFAVVFIKEISTAYARSLSDR